MLATTRSEAKALGLKRYFTGVPCCRGHISERFAKGECVECFQGDGQRQAARDRAKQWRAGNREKHRKYCAQYQASNAEKHVEASKRFYTNNTEYNVIRKRNERARRRNAEGFHTSADIERIRAEQHNTCAYCKCDLVQNSHVDHIQPLARGGSNWPSNLQITCNKCNLRKGTKTSEEFRQALREATNIKL